MFYHYPFCFYFPQKQKASRINQVISFCESFAACIDALKTLEFLALNIDDYSIGVNNTAKIFLLVYELFLLFTLSHLDNYRSSTKTLWLKKIRFLYK